MHTVTMKIKVNVKSATQQKKIKKRCHSGEVTLEGHFNGKQIHRLGPLTSFSLFASQTTILPTAFLCK